MYKLIVFVFFVITSNSFAQKTKKIQYLATYTVTASEKTKKVVLTCLLPQNIPNVQKVDSITYSLAPKRVYTHAEDEYVEFEIDSIKGDFQIKIRVVMDIFRNTLSSKATGPLTTNTNQFLQAERYLESDHKLLLKKAAELQNKETIKTIQNIYNFVRKTMNYTSYNPKDMGALSALQSQKGDCTEFSDLFVALCRACKIPARVVEGYKIESITMPQHNWAEVYIEDLGWRMIDPTSYALEPLENGYIKLSSNRNVDFQDTPFHYYSYKYWGQAIQIKKNFEAAVLVEHNSKSEN